jgi:hypothetical protein
MHRRETIVITVPFHKGGGGLLESVSCKIFLQDFRLIWSLSGVESVDCVIDAVVFNGFADQFPVTLINTIDPFDHTVVFSIQVSIGKDRGFSGIVSIYMCLFHVVPPC